MKIIEKMLTTTDNPYNPFDDFDAWYGFDLAHGYDSCAYLARSCYSSPSLGEIEEIQTQNAAIDQIVRLNATGVWKAVEREIEID